MPAGGGGGGGGHYGQGGGAFDSPVIWIWIEISIWIQKIQVLAFYRKQYKICQSIMGLLWSRMGLLWLGNQSNPIWCGCFDRPLDKIFSR